MHMQFATYRLGIAAIVVTLSAPIIAEAGDWPLWRYDAQRSAASPDGLPRTLQAHWVRKLPALKPAWPDQPKMQFDAACEPVVKGARLFVGSSHDHSVTAYDTRTGEEVWTFFANGPVRFAPLAWKDNLYFVSDDGHLYCLNASSGSLVWKFRGGPSDRQILGNERLISMWPARGAPVIVEDAIYFAAGIWPFMGIFLHALDADTGEVIWTNDGDGSIYIKQPHNTDSFAGVAPQGPLAVIGDKLLIPGGRSIPACYDRRTGKLLYYQLAENGKRGGGSAVAAVDRLLFNGGAAFDLETEKYLGGTGEHVVFANDRLYFYDEQELFAHDLKSSRVQRDATVDRKGEKSVLAKWQIDELSRVKVPALTALIQAGPRLYAGAQGRVFAFDSPLPKEGNANPVWQAEIEGTCMSLVAADDRLFAVTKEGALYCFGDASGAPGAPRQHELAARPLAAVAAWSNKVTSFLNTTGVRDGYCVAWGVGSGGLLTELLRQSELRVIVVEADLSTANAFRAELRASGLGSDRVSVIVTDPLKATLPPYLASLMVAESIPTEKEARVALVSKMFESLRPFGGTACLPVPSKEAAALQVDVEQLQLAGAVYRSAGEMLLVARQGPLPGSADWTHEHADAANTRVSKDLLAKAPLGLLWFGGPTNDAILPRHGHGPQPQVVDGRLFIEGVDLLRAMDIYTGRVLWEAPLPGVGTLYDNTAHQPGANASGTNYIATPDGIYVAHGRACVTLDPATGKETARFHLPKSTNEKEPPLWGYINVFEDYLVGGADPLFDPALAKLRADNDNYSSSSRLVVMHRKTGEVLWTANAQSGFRHNALCIGGGRLYCIDRLSGPQLSRLQRRGENPLGKPRLVVFDLKTGRELWSTDYDVFGTWLSYSAERDLLVEAGRVARDTLGDEPKGMRTYRAVDGSVQWESKTHTGPAMIHHDTILMAGNACDLLTGNLRMREHPLTGESVEWTWSRNYGCNTPLASENLLTFRSGAAGYLDFTNDGGTGNFGGFRSSCTNNLIVAGGLINVPEYTRTCTCSYQNQTSLALVHMPEVETWTSFGAQTPKHQLRRVGINLGAPGDRKADDGTLWLEFPSVGGSSPPISVAVEPKEPVWFRRHSSQVSGPGLPWVAASGAKGLTSLRVTLGTTNEANRRYTVRLHFLEPDDVKPGARVFGVSVQGSKKLAALDVVKEAGGRNLSLVKEFAGVDVGQNLLIELTPSPAARLQSPVLSGVEILPEGW